MSPEEHRKLLERRANVVRSRLLRTIDALDARRHQVEVIGEQAKKVALPVAATFLGGAVVGIRSIFKRRHERLLSVRFANAIERWRPQKKPSFMEDLGRKALSSLVMLVTTEVARRSLKNVFDGRLPDGHLVETRMVER